MIPKKCKYCDKEIEGHTYNQVDHMMTQHMIARHKDKLNEFFQEKKDE